MKNTPEITKRWLWILFGLSAVKLPNAEFESNMNPARCAKIYLHTDGSLWLFLRNGEQMKLEKSKNS